MELKYTKEQREALARAINDDDREVPEVVAAAAAGTLDGLESFEIQPGHAARIAAEEASDRRAEQLAAEAIRNPAGYEALALGMREQFVRQLEHFKSTADGGTKPSDFTQWATALGRVMALTDKVERRLARKLKRGDLDPVEPDPEPGMPDKGSTLADQLRAEHLETVAANGHGAGQKR